MEKYFYAKLIRLYPDKIIQHLNYNHPNLYQHLCRVSREKEISLQSLLESMGFTYLLSKRGVPSNFDLLTTERLISEFGLSQKEIGNYLGTTRQAVNNKIIRGVSSGSWQSNELNEEEIQLIVEMVNDNIFDLNEEGLAVSIRNNFKDICIILVRDNEIKVIFNIPENIHVLLKKNKYHLFSKIDLKIKANLIPVRILGKKLAIARDHSTQTKITNQCNKKKYYDR